MANEEQLSILKSGVSAWNKWRSENPEIIVDLSGINRRGAALKGVALYLAEVSGADLSEANLSNAHLSEANLSWANLSGADLRKATLIDGIMRGANLRKANLRKVNLSGARLDQASLIGADLSEASLIGADLSEADLSGANMRGAGLHLANLRGARLLGSDLSNSRMLFTSVTGIDLSGVKGLETVAHQGPSYIGIETIYRSKGEIPEVFLRGAGVPENFISFMKSLAGTPAAFEFYSCFISYSTKDKDFAERLHADLDAAHVRCWFAPKNLEIGDEIRPEIDEAIRIYDKLLLILSNNSIRSQWVKKEVETAFERERKKRNKVLFPIRLDAAVMRTKQAWAADIRRTRQIGDFRNWKSHHEYKKAFDRLLRGLKAKGKNPPIR